MNNSPPPDNLNSWNQLMPPSHSPSTANSLSHNLWSYLSVMLWGFQTVRVAGIRSLSDLVIEHYLFLPNTSNLRFQFFGRLTSSAMKFQIVRSISQLSHFTLRCHISKCNAGKVQEHPSAIDRSILHKSKTQSISNMPQPEDLWVLNIPFFQVKGSLHRGFYITIFTSRPCVKIVTYYHPSAMLYFCWVCSVAFVVARMFRLRPFKLTQAAQQFVCPLCQSLASLCCRTAKLLYDRLPAFWLSPVAGHSLPSERRGHASLLPFAVICMTWWLLFAWLLWCCPFHGPFSFLVWMYGNSCFRDLLCFSLLCFALPCRLV